MCMCVQMHVTCVWIPARLRMTPDPWSWSYRWLYADRHVYGDPNSGPLKEHLTVKSPLQPLTFNYESMTGGRGSNCAKNSSNNL